jgi:N-acetylglucosaminyldiphosphoundecaprenol N-acetyl-beta-D-mannosaminyltransferase
MPNILGIKLSDWNQKQALIEIDDWLRNKKKGYLVTPNPEIILAALKDDVLKNIINQADFSLADGFGLKIAAKLKGQRIKRVTGSDLSLELLELAQKNNYKVAIIIWNKGLSSQEDVVISLAKKYPNLVFQVYKSNRIEKLDSDLIREINQFCPQLLFVALGSPEQEKIIHNNLANLECVNLALGVGGTFDFITRKVKRAPYFLRYLGLEWLWRLILQPQRIKRIYRATFVFIYKVLTYKGN